MNGDDDFVTKTAKHRKKQHAAANGDDKSAADSKLPPPPQTAASGSSASGSAPTAAADGISLRPRTMFAMKGRGRAEAEGSAYRPQWSKDGEGFVTAGTTSAAGAAKDAYYDAQGAADAARRKGKVLRYTKEELLALHFTTTSPPEFPPETMVASELALPPVTTLPFDYEEIYEQWKLNRNRGGRGRGRGTSTQNESGAGPQQPADRSRSNGRWGEDDKWEKPATRRDAGDGPQQGGGDDTWQRGLRPSATRHRDDIWDNVGDGSSESNEMDLSSMAEAAEKFRLEMDALREELNAPLTVDLQKENNGNLDEFDKKLEVAAAAGQFDDSDEEDAQWDEPTAVGDVGGGGVVDEWFYLDPQGNQQGPFKSLEMREWFEAGYFKPHLPIRFGGGDGQFTPLASHFVPGQTPFAAPLPQPSPSIGGASESDRQRLYALQQQEVQRQEQHRQEQQLLQLQQQQQEHQRMLQEEKVRMEMQKLEMARQQQQHQSHLYQQQLLQQQQQQHHLLQQQQQQQQHMLLQQQTSWQRSQREGIMSALGIFGGEQDRGIPTTEGFHNVMQPQFQSEFRTQHHLGTHDPALRDALFLNDGGARQQNEFWGQGGPGATGAPTNTFAPQPESRSPQPQETATEQQQATAAPADLPWGPSTSETESVSSTSLHQIQNEEKRKAADEVRPSPVKAAAPRTAPASKQQQPPTPAAPAVAPVATDAQKKAPKPKAKAAAAAPSEAGKPAWVDPSAASTKSLQKIQQEEQRELRRRMEDTVGGANLEQMGAQLKMMLGVQPSATASAGSGASPWGVSTTATAQPTQAAKQQSLRDILAEEERLAHERAKQSQNASAPSSHWVNVVAGTTPAAAPKPSRALGPVPVSVLKSRQQVRASNGADSTTAAGVKPVGPTPPKSDNDASFWNFGAAQTAKAAATAASSSGTATPGGVTMSNAFGGSAGVSSEFLAWAAKQYQLISGRDDLTLVEYCVSLEDPGEIREYLAAYLGSTPRVSAFATEFIQRKKKGPSLTGSTTLKRSPSASNKMPTDDDTAAASASAKKNSGSGKRRGGKGQKIDPSLLNFA